MNQITISQLFNLLEKSRDSDLAHFFEDGVKMKTSSEIFPPLH